MLREVTRQLYAKTAEQGDTNAELAESRAECAELGREQQNDAQGVGERKARPGPVI